MNPKIVLRFYVLTLCPVWPGAVSAIVCKF